MTTQPNIIMIMTDQQRYDTIGALGWPYMETPVLDRLVNEGTAFTDTCACGASCVPSRASLFTGYFPHTTGVLSNWDTWRHSWVEDLNDAGYHCVNVGKMHAIPFDNRLGFHERYIFENKLRRTDFGGRGYIDLEDVVLAARGLNSLDDLNFRGRSDYGESLGAFEWPLEDDLHYDFLVGNLAKWWIREHRRRRDSKKPLFLQIGFPGPHPPYDPISRFIDLYRDKEFPIPPITDSDLQGQPEAYREMRTRMQTRQPDCVAHKVIPSQEARRRQRIHYYANVSMIDQKVGEILETLKSEGYLEDCIVVFTSDHGDALSDHGHCEKWTMYDPIVKVPLVFWGPGRIPSGRRIDSLVQLMDVGPTILDFAGIERPESMEAISMREAFGQGAFGGRDYVFCEHGRDPALAATEFMTMVRSKDWKLVHFIDDDFGQLFDLKNDPAEVENLWNCNPEKRAELLSVMYRWRMQSQLRTRDWTQRWR